jgi:ABC-type transporter Mla subunit MlaD
MPWISDQTIQLYREINASLSQVAEAIIQFPRILRRIQQELIEMAKSNAQVLDEVRQTRGFVASLIASQEALRQAVKDALANHEVDQEVSDEVDKLFDEAKAGATATAGAIVANPGPTDPPAPTPPGG